MGQVAVVQVSRATNSYKSMKNVASRRLPFAAWVMAFKNMAGDDPFLNSTGGTHRQSA